MNDPLLLAAGFALLASAMTTAGLVAYDRLSPAGHVQQRHDLALAGLITGPLVFLIALLPQTIEILAPAPLSQPIAQPASQAPGVWVSELTPETTGSGFPRTVLPSLVDLWVLGVVALLLRLGRDLFSLRALLRHSQPAATELAAGLSRRVELRTTHQVSEPMLAGYLHPVIYLPITFDLEGPGRRAVLEHEIAHLERRDTWTLLAERLITAVFWWILPVRLLIPVLSKARESLCDRYAAEQTGDPLLMAHALLDTAERRCAGPALALAMAGHRSALSQRIHYLADLKPSSNKATLMKLPLILPALAAIALIATPRVGAAIEVDPSGLDKVINLPGHMAAHSTATRLIEAVEAGDIQQLNRLLEQGLDPDSLAMGDGTALIVASRRGDSAMVNLLLEAGADPDQIASGDGTALIQAAAGNHRSVAEKLLRAGADVNGFAPADETPLINAARAGHIDMAELLFEAGADLSLTVEADTFRDGTEYRSAISEARRYNQHAMVRWLEDRGAQHRPPAL